MQTNSQPIITQILEAVLLKVWDGVAVENIKKMAPFSARL